MGGGGGGEKEGEREEGGGERKKGGGGGGGREGGRKGRNLVGARGVQPEVLECSDGSNGSTVNNVSTVVQNMEIDPNRPHLHRKHNPHSLFQYQNGTHLLSCYDAQGLCVHCPRLLEAPLQSSAHLCRHTRRPNI